MSLADGVWNGVGLSMLLGGNDRQVAGATLAYHLIRFSQSHHAKYPALYLGKRTFCGGQRR